MKSLIVLALAAVAMAHWPYADLENKFRMASIAVAGNGDDVNTEYAWIFSPLNNQNQPTFQLRFPNKQITYTLQLSHVAEVKPSGGIFQLVSGSTINFNDAEWVPGSGNWFYDDETFGEVVELDLFPDTVDGKLDERWVVSLTLRVYPDSQDDLVDLKVMFDNYEFVDDDTQFFSTQYAIFFKLVASTGDDAELRNLPLSVDWDHIKFEVNAEVHIDACATKSAKRNATVRTEKKKVAKNVKKSPQSLVKRMHKARQDTPMGETTAQLWFTGGYVATVVGLLPGDFCGGAVWTVVTLSLRTPNGNL